MAKTKKTAEDAPTDARAEEATTDAPAEQPAPPDETAEPSRVAVLCPGESLKNLKRKPRADLVIGVNRAVLTGHCDVWAALDLPLIERTAGKVEGAVALLTNRATLDSLRRRKHKWAAPEGGAVATDDLRKFLNPSGVGWTLYTATSAVIYAASRGAQRIDVYGRELSGTADYDGEEAGENRTPDRWEQERQVWDALVERLASRGVTVNFVKEEA